MKHRDLTLRLVILCLLFLGMISVSLNFSQLERNRDLEFDIEIEGQKYAAEVDRALYAEAARDELKKEVAELREDMDRLAALQEIAPFVEPDYLALVVDKLVPATPFDSPFKITARWGEGPGYNGGYRTSHAGTDIVPEGSSRVRPTWDGVVEEISIDRFLGKYIIVDHGDGVRTRYAHLDTIFNTALPGQRVTTETVIGVMGSTGYSDAAHLHLELLIFAGDNWHDVDIYSFLKRSAS